MKITVITGSPRKQGNSFAMTDAFIRSAEQRGHTVQRFDAAFLKIGGCHACMTCYKTGKACSFDDDFNRIAPAILESDAVVFTMPVYWYSIPAQIKGVIDRLFSLVVRSEEQTSELQARFDPVCRLLLEKKNFYKDQNTKRTRRCSISIYMFNSKIY